MQTNTQQTLLFFIYQNFYWLVLIFKHPLLFFFITLSLSAGFFSNKIPSQLFGRWGGSLLLWFSVVVLLIYTALIIWYISFNHFSDHIEASITSVSWMFYAHQMPLYHSIDSAERYSMMYGPMLYLVYTAALAVFGASLITIKALPGVCALLSLVILFLALKRLTTSKVALLATGLTGLGYLLFGTISFCARGDAMMLLLESLLLYGLVCLSGIPCFILMFLVAGLFINFKIHAWIYLLPFFALFCKRFNFWRLLLALCFAAAVAALPFCLSSKISFNNYLLWIYWTGLNNGFSWYGLLINLQYALLISIPVILLIQYQKGKWQRPFHDFDISWYALLGAGYATLTGAIGGGGPYHLLHCLMPLTYISVVSYEIILKTKRNEGRGLPAIIRVVFLAFVLTLFAVTCGRQYAIWSLTAQYRNYEVKEDIEKILKKHPGKTLAIGYGGDYQLTFYHPLLIFAGNTFLIDAVVLYDMGAAGISRITEKTLKRLKSCDVQIWMIPQGGNPFERQSMKLPYDNVFSDEFIKIFFEKYAFKERTEFYDLWFCEE